MPLFQRRQREREKAQRSARGEPVPLTTRFDHEVRTRLLYAIIDHAPAFLHDFTRSSSEILLAGIRHTVLREWGKVTLAQQADQAKDLMAFLVEVADGGQVLDVIEAFFTALDEAETQTGQQDWTGLRERFRDRVNDIFNEHDVAYQMIGPEVIPRDSMAMHAEVVAPALGLLHGERRFTRVESAFHKALQELKPGGDPTDAITDAGTALQEMLIALGAKGNSLGPLLDSARRKGLLGPHDSKLALGIEQIGDWVSADRSVRGDAHVVTDAGIYDAWLAVHVVGALVLRLGSRL